MQLVRLSKDEWWSEAMKRCENFKDLALVCPSCKHVQTPRDFHNAGVPWEEIDGKFGFSCIGRWLEVCQDAFTGGPGPCNYAGGGLMRVAPIVLVGGEKDHYVFDFAKNPLAAPAPEQEAASAAVEE